MLHHVTVKQHIKLFKSGTVTFHFVMLIMSHLYDKSQKYIPCTVVSGSLKHVLSLSCKSKYWL